jgi:predicted enzyme related to lactoylglutathione lyase
MDREFEHGIRLSTINLNAPDASALGAFYARLLGWEVRVDEPGWVVVAGPEYVALSFETDENFTPPVWPSEPGQPPIQLHLDVRVTDLEGAVRHAEDCGATQHQHQPQPDVRVMVDPAGHVFCLWLDAHTMS